MKSILASLAFALASASALAAGAPIVTAYAPIDISGGSQSFGTGALPTAAATGAIAEFTFFGLSSGVYSYLFEADGGATGHIALDSVSLDGNLLSGSTLTPKLFSFEATEALGSSFVLDIAYDKPIGAASIGGSVSLSPVVAAVPEPTTAALMLAGLGLAAFVGQRRKAR